MKSKIDLDWFYQCFCPGGCPIHNRKGCISPDERAKLIVSATFRGDIDHKLIDRVTYGFDDNDVHDLQRALNTPKKVVPQYTVNAGKWNLWCKVLGHKTEYVVDINTITHYKVCHRCRLCEPVVVI